MTGPQRNKRSKPTNTVEYSGASTSNNLCRATFNNQRTIVNPVTASADNYYQPVAPISIADGDYRPSGAIPSFSDGRNIMRRGRGSHKGRKRKHIHPAESGEGDPTDEGRVPIESDILVFHGPALTCALCSQSFETDQQLTSHISQFHDDQKLNSMITAVTPTTTVTDKSGGKRYRCNLCHQIFSAGYSIKKHIRVHTRERPFSCDFCGELFSQWGNLRLHIQRHLGINPYRCPYCDKAYIAPSKLEVHIRGHTNERPFPCNLCDSCFKSSDDLRKHMMIHANYKPFVCWQCRKAFMQPSKLKQHMKEKHGIDVEIVKKGVSDKGAEYEIRVTEK